MPVTKKCKTILKVSKLARGMVLEATEAPETMSIIDNLMKTGSNDEEHLEEGAELMVQELEQLAEATTLFYNGVASPELTHGQIRALSHVYARKMSLQAVKTYLVAQKKSRNQAYARLYAHGLTAGYVKELQHFFDTDHLKKNLAVIGILNSVKEAVLDLLVTEGKMPKRRATALIEQKFPSVANTTLKSIPRDTPLQGQAFLEDFQKKMYESLLAV